MAINSDIATKTDICNSDNSRMLRNQNILPNVLDTQMPQVVFVEIPLLKTLNHMMRLTDYIEALSQ